MNTVKHLCLILYIHQVLIFLSPRATTNIQSDLPVDGNTITELDLVEKG